MDDDAVRRITERPGPGSHRVTVSIDGRPVDTLAELPPAPGGLLFVDDAPSSSSVEAGHHQQHGDGHRLWERLVRAGVLPAGTRYETADDALVAMGHGLAVLDAEPWSDEPAPVAEGAATGEQVPSHATAGGPSGDRCSAGDGVSTIEPARSGRPSDAELIAGVGPLWQRIALWRPAAVVFLSRRAAEVVAGRPLPGWGVLDSVALAGRPCILLPPPDAEDESERVGIDLLRNLLAALPQSATRTDEGARARPATAPRGA